MTNGDYYENYKCLTLIYFKSYLKSFKKVICSLYFYKIILLFLKIQENILIVHIKKKNKNIHV
jgi:hypothetical protein